MNIKYQNSFVIIIISLIFNNVFSAEYGAWINTDSMRISRPGFSSVILSNGNILISGGDKDSLFKNSEIYDVLNEKWVLTNPMKSARAYHHLVALKNEQIFAIGGSNNRSCEIYDPINEIWEFTDSTSLNNIQTATLLEDGRVLITGSYQDANASEFYDPLIKNGK